ncbi:unnamed protein product, partial [Symbiodinium sp. KB8]
MFSEDHEQWEFGVAALIVVLLWGLVATTYRLFLRNKRSFSLKTLVFALASYAVAAICGAIIYSITDSAMTLCVFVYLPPTLIFFGVAYGLWVHQDYRFRVNYPLRPHSTRVNA